MSSRQNEGLGPPPCGRGVANLEERQRHDPWHRQAGLAPALRFAAWSGPGGYGAYLPYRVPAGKGGKGSTPFRRVDLRL
jgi:hypothetical protein